MSQNEQSQSYISLLKNLGNFWGTRIRGIYSDIASTIAVLTFLDIGTLWALITHANTIFLFFSIALLLTTIFYAFFWRKQKQKAEIESTIYHDKWIRPIRGYARFSGLLILILAGIFWFSMSSGGNPDDLTVLIANFDGPKQSKYSFNTKIQQDLERKLSSIPNVKIELIRNTITPEDGIKSARRELQKRQASMLIWGWYDKSGNESIVNFNIEVLKHPESLFNLNEEVQSQLNVFNSSELEAFSVTEKVAINIETSAILMLGVLNYELANWDIAINCFNDALAEDNSFRLSNFDKHLVYIYRGRSYREIGNYDLAISDYNKSLELEPDSEWAYIDKAISYENKGQLEKAVQSYQEALAKHPTSFIAHTKLAWLCVKTGELDKAEIHLNQATRITDNFSETFLVKGILDYARRKFNLAIDDYSKAIQINPKLAENYFYRGNAYLARNNPDPAWTEYIESIKKDPSKSLGAYMKYMNSYGFKDDVLKAILDYGKAIRINKKFSQAYLNRSIAFRRYNEDYRALSTLEDLVKVEPENDFFYAEKGVLNLDLGKYDEALKDFEKAIEINSNEAAYYATAALASQYKGDIKDAIAYRAISF